MGGSSTPEVRPPNAVSASFFGLLLGALIPVPANSPGGRVWQKYTWACLPFIQVGSAESNCWCIMRVLLLRRGFRLAALVCHWNKNKCLSLSLNPHWLATASAVFPCTSLMSIEAPFSSIISIALECPCDAAACRGVLPNGVVIFTFAFASSIRLLIRWLLPRWAAIKRATPALSSATETLVLYKEGPRDSQFFSATIPSWKTWSTVPRQTAPTSLSHIRHNFKLIVAPATTSLCFKSESSNISPSSKYCKRCKLHGMPATSSA